ncbi:MAG: shikimate kinase [Candidatus Hydrogenedentota bacterium]|nr:MAG: shikimate kinase [Candidatus Hydrogenedentota bacterium]
MEEQGDLQANQTEAVEEVVERTTQTENPSSAQRTSEKTENKNSKKNFRRKRSRNFQKKKSHRKTNKKRKSEKNKKRNILKPVDPVHPKIALLGFRGIGKSTIAKRLAKRWNIEVIHLDRKIEQDNQKTIHEIVEEQGWEVFRQLETKALKDVIENQTGNVLLDTGGGIIETAAGTFNEENAQYLKDNFFCIYLYVDEDHVIKRHKMIHKNPARPDLDTELIEVYRRRKPWYQKASHAVVDISDCSAEEAAERVFSLVQASRKEKK